MRSPSTPAGPTAKKPQSPGTSSPKSNDASSSIPRVAKKAAKDAFTKASSLPFQAEPNSPRDESGRQRLKGAFLIDIDRIQSDPDQPRKDIDPQQIAELAASIRRLGIIQAITVRYVNDEDVYRIIGGECRYQAAKRAGLKQLPCWIKTPDSEDVLLMQIAENWQRSNLQPFELADSLALLRDSKHLTQRKLAQEIGKSEGEVSKLLTLLDLSPDVQRIARDDRGHRITKRHLYSIGRLPVEQQTVILQRVQERDLTVADTERMIERLRATQSPARSSGAPVFRRKVMTKYGSVLMTFRRKDVSASDMIALLREAIAQLKEEQTDPADSI